MENDANGINIEQSPKNYLNSKSNSLMVKEEFKNINEEHILSLRKKRGNRQIEHLKKIKLIPQNLNHEINLNELIPLIQNEELFIKYNSNENETEKLNILLQMLISENINILKYGLIQLKKYINNINDSNEFISKNLLVQFNEKMFRFLFTLLFKNNYINKEDYYQIISLLCFIISKLCYFNDFYIGILFDYITDLLNLAKNEQDKQIKNSIYIITQKVLLINKIKDDELFNQKIVQIYNIFFNQIYNELFELNNEVMNNKNILFIKDLFPTLIKIINNIICINIQSPNNNFLIDLKKLSNILSFLKKYLDISFMETEILKSTLHFLNIILNYYKSYKNKYDKESEIEFKNIIKDIKLDKHIISYINDNSVNDYEFRYEIIEIINNMILLNDNDFINNLIENNISEQISHLQDFLLKYDNNNSNSNSNNIIKFLYKSHIELIYNLISTQSENAIQNICIEHSCISNLFQFINNSSFLYNKDNLKIIEIFDLIIQSKAEYVHSLLLTEGIYELYKNILNDNNNNKILLIILKDFSIMIERGKSIKTSNGINYVSNHFIKKGIFDLINNIKSRTDLNEQITYLLDEIPKLLEEKTI